MGVERYRQDPLCGYFYTRSMLTMARIYVCRVHRLSNSNSVIKGASGHLVHHACGATTQSSLPKGIWCMCQGSKDLVDSLRRPLTVNDVHNDRHGPLSSRGGLDPQTRVIVNTHTASVWVVHDDRLGLH
jgi:hypothetical protein